jgi:hypothetical protein
MDVRTQENAVKIIANTPLFKLIPSYRAIFVCSLFSKEGFCSVSNLRYGILDLQEH